MQTVLFTFKINGRLFNMSLPYIGSPDNSLIVTDEFRTYKALTYPNSTDFVNNTRFLLSSLECTPINSKDDYAFALVKLCEKHVKDYNRIIDTDLYTYLDQLLLIIKSLAKLEGLEISNEMGNAYWEFFKTVSFGVFEQYLWLNVPSIPFDHNPLSKSTRLIKYTDYNE